MTHSGQADCQPNVVTYTSAIGACVAGSQWVLALRWKAEMQSRGVEPYFTTYVYLVSVCAEAQQWAWVRHLLDEVYDRHQHTANFKIEQIYTIVLLKCLKHNEHEKALEFVEDLGSGADISCLSPLLLSCEHALDHKDWVRESTRCELSNWSEELRRSAVKNMAALGSKMGHGRGWQRDALGKVALTMDLLSWHGLSATYKELQAKFAEAVMQPMMEAILASGVPFEGQRFSTQEPILSGTQLEGVTMGAYPTRKALWLLQMAASSTSNPRWLRKAQLETRRTLLSGEGDGPFLSDDPGLSLQARWISCCKRSPRGALRGEEKAANRGIVALGADDGCGEWIRAAALDVEVFRELQVADRRSSGFSGRHGELLEELMSQVLQVQPVQPGSMRPGKVGRDGTVRLYMTYNPCMACLASFYQIQQRYPGVKLEVAFDGFRETRYWTG
eukprot:TRINITY_DN48950_c0_g1_i1.p1 TRINITY_DN48950_c0_g1~~TRINITY_DN48950_c0_g1_i1.p1  ORF type:complete len:498 (+),score=90.11 TRINITY_DN48950_c0_g1_i1:162-1496(+)